MSIRKKISRFLRFIKDDDRHSDMLSIAMIAVGLSCIPSGGLIGFLWAVNVILYSTGLFSRVRRTAERAGLSKNSAIRKLAVRSNEFPRWARSLSSIVKASMLAIIISNDDDVTVERMDKAQKYASKIISIMEDLPEDKPSEDVVREVNESIALYVDKMDALVSNGWLQAINKETDTHGIGTRKDDDTESSPYAMRSLRSIQSALSTLENGTPVNVTTVQDQLENNGNRPAITGTEKHMLSDESLITERKRLDDVIETIVSNGTKSEEQYDSGEKALPVMAPMGSSGSTTVRESTDTVES